MTYSCSSSSVDFTEFWNMAFCMTFVLQTMCRRQWVEQAVLLKAIQFCPNGLAFAIRRPGGSKKPIDLKWGLGQCFARFDWTRPAFLPSAYASILALLPSYIGPAVAWNFGPMCPYRPQIRLGPAGLISDQKCYWPTRFAVGIMVRWACKWGGAQAHSLN